MTAEDYKSQRQRRGTQTSVAALLGIHQVTVARRETGALPISTEAERALLSLPKKRKKNEKC
jgi:hypothetical protein